MKQILVALAGAAIVTYAQAATAQTVVGTVTVCYYSAECGFANVPGILHAPDEAQKLRDSGEHEGVLTHSATGATPVDAPAFEFTNTSATAITGANFSIAPNGKLGVILDVFHIGTIKPGASFVIVPGASNDKKVHKAGAFFAYSSPGNPLDTSDSGPNANTLKFTFAGKLGTQTITSGPIFPGNSLSKSADGTVASLNFLGGPGNADGPCNDCYAAKVVAQLTASAASVVPHH
jgi:hypothetical protein